jgi:hypothetical protein
MPLQRDARCPVSFLNVMPPPLSSSSSSVEVESRGGGALDERPLCSSDKEVADASDPPPAGRAERLLLPPLHLVDFEPRGVQRYWTFFNPHRLAFFMPLFVTILTTRTSMKSSPYIPVNAFDSSPWYREGSMKLAGAISQCTVGRERIIGLVRDMWSALLEHSDLAVPLI